MPWLFSPENNTVMSRKKRRGRKELGCRVYRPQLTLLSRLLNPLQLTHLSLIYSFIYHLPRLAAGSAERYKRRRKRRRCFCYHWPVEWWCWSEERKEWKKGFRQYAWEERSERNTKNEVMTLQSRGRNEGRKGNASMCKKEWNEKS